MGRIGLIDVDGHHFPNLALMRVSAFHKSVGDSVSWCKDGIERFDKVYCSKVFNGTYSKDIEFYPNAEEVIYGGTGYSIYTDASGKEHFLESMGKVLPPDMESAFPDYSIYPQYNFAVSMTSRGCPRGCGFCHVAPKEGRKSVKVANVSDFYSGHKLIKVLDPNITACPDKFDLLRQYADTNAWCDFTQGIDARLLTENVIQALNGVKIKQIHFAWDDMKQSESVIKGLTLYKNHGNIKNHRRLAVYVLTNFDTSHEEDLYRVHTLREIGFDPYVMIYNKPSAPAETKKLQSWCNNKIVFNAVPKFDDFDWNTRKEIRRLK